MVYCRDARSGRPPAGGKIVRREIRQRGPMRVADAQTGRPYSNHLREMISL
jgi:hypothetical protein